VIVHDKNYVKTSHWLEVNHSVEIGKVLREMHHLCLRGMGKGLRDVPFVSARDECPCEIGEAG
jgi:hypothetical protein